MKQLTPLDQAAINLYNNTLSRTIAALAAAVYTERKAILRADDMQPQSAWETEYETILDHAQELAYLAVKKALGDNAAHAAMEMESLLRVDNTEPRLRLTADEAAITAFLEKDGKKCPAQSLTIMRLQSCQGIAEFTPGFIQEIAGVTPATVGALRDRGLLELVA